jgi:hypothetical protein
MNPTDLLERLRAPLFEPSAAFSDVLIALVRDRDHLSATLAELRTTVGHLQHRDAAALEMLKKSQAESTTALTKQLTRTGLRCRAPRVP